jgi:hypothetical protein
MALMLGALMFMLTKTRGYVDPDDSLLGYFMLAGFFLWLLGLAALYARYAPLSGGLGKTGLGMSFVGIVLLAVGHPFSFVTRLDLFVLVILGTLVLILGPLLFGLAAWRTLMFGPDVAQSKILPRRLRAVPLFTGLMGLAWFFNTGETTFLFSGPCSPSGGC